MKILKKKCRAKKLNKVNSLMFKLAIIVLIIACISYVYNDFFAGSEPVAKSVKCYNISKLDGQKLNTSILNGTK